MRSSVKYVLAAVSIATMALPAWARTDKMALSVSHPVMVGKTKLDAGTYQVKADEDQNTLEVQKDGETVATVQGHWNKMKGKADYSAAEYNGNSLDEVEFEGNSMVFDVAK